MYKKEPLCEKKARSCEKRSFYVQGGPEDVRREAPTCKQKLNYSTKPQLQDKNQLRNNKSNHETQIQKFNKRKT